MFEAAELGRTVSKAVYNKKDPELRTALLDAQFKLRELPFPVIIIVSGVEADPRFLGRKRRRARTAPFLAFLAEITAEIDDRRALWLVVHNADHRPGIRQAHEG